MEKEKENKPKFVTGDVVFAENTVCKICKKPLEKGHICNEKGKKDGNPIE